ncbi:hypothetical protein SDC9_146796 [bioreactor metagenome]|uniref:Uncharacterized protein n=1 Tax=bioreactor metagenome TaxID=1076179 RepID=A0A645EC38_9ZZZZ
MHDVFKLMIISVIVRSVSLRTGVIGTPFCPRNKSQIEYGSRKRELRKQSIRYAHINSRSVTGNAEAVKVELVNIAFFVFAQLHSFI